MISVNQTHVFLIKVLDGVRFSAHLDCLISLPSTQTDQIYPNDILMHSWDKSPLNRYGSLSALLKRSWLLLNVLNEALISSDRYTMRFGAVLALCSYVWQLLEHSIIPKMYM